LSSDTVFPPDVPIHLLQIYSHEAQRERERLMVMEKETTDLQLRGQARHLLDLPVKARTFFLTNALNKLIEKHLVLEQHRATVTSEHEVLFQEKRLTDIEGRRFSVEISGATTHHQLTDVRERLNTRWMDVSSRTKEVFWELIAQIKSHPKSTRCTGNPDKNTRWLMHIAQGHNHACIPTHNFAQPFQFFLVVDSTNRTVRFDLRNFNPYTLQQQILRCPSHLVVLLFVLVFETESHANVLFVNKKDATYERFEPHGGSSFAEVDFFLQTSEFKMLLPSRDYRYIAPSQVCPSLGPQGRQLNDIVCAQLGEYGFCQAFALMYAHLRILLPEVDSKEIYAIWLSLTDADLLDAVKRYMGWIDVIIPDVEAPGAEEVNAEQSTCVIC
jgi:hypothetical protein